jgi:Enterobacteriaceae phage serine recombinase
MEPVSKMKVAIYARVSTLDQKPDLQLRELEEFAARRGDEVVAIFQERISGVKTKRPALDALLGAAKKGEFEAVLFWRISRLGRSATHLRWILDFFKLQGIPLISMNEGIDFSTPAGKMIYGVIAEVVEMERETIRENVRAGIAAYRERHQAWGKRAFKLDQARVQKAFQDRERGHSWASLEADYGIPARSLGRAFRALAKTPAKLTRKKGRK